MLGACASNDAAGTITGSTAPTVAVPAMLAAAVNACDSAKRKTLAVAAIAADTESGCAVRTSAASADAATLAAAVNGCAIAIRFAVAVAAIAAAADNACSAPTTDIAATPATPATDAIALNGCAVAR